MDFWSSVKVLAKRWYIVAIGLLVTCGAAVGVNSLISPSYTAAGSVVLSVPPNLPDRAASSNPYLAYGNLAVTAKVVSSAMSQPSVVREQQSKGASGSFVIGLDPERSSPIITIDSQAPTAAAAIRTVEVVTTGLRELLAERQRALGAPQNTWITANSVVVPEEANRAIGSRLRATSAVLVLGFIATLSLAFAVEGWGQGRAREAAGASARLRDAVMPAPPTQPPTPAVAPPPPTAPVGACPLCHAPFGAADALASHLENVHGLSDGPHPAPAPAPRPRAVRLPEDALAPDAPRTRTRRAVGESEPAPKARAAKKAVPGPATRAPKSQPPSR